uniref:Uncharacterized protein n=1 Tax=Anguilla anguilla TaxID=7936 RepID=A0A0E9XRF6_ANGAN
MKLLFYWECFQLSFKGFFHVAFIEKALIK